MSPPRPLAIRIVVGIGRLLGRLLRGSDRAAGGLARVSATLGQVALVCLGVHLAADQLDDRALAGLTALQGWLDTTLAGPLGGAAESMGMGFDALLFWDGLPLSTMSAWLALVVELLAAALLCSSFLLTGRKPTLSWSAWRSALSIHALVLPITLAGVLLAGSWSMAMAAEDLMPVHVASRWAAGLLGLAVLLRFGLPAWGRAVAVLERSGKPRRDLLVALVMTPVGLLAWMHGVPIWGWLP